MFEDFITPLLEWLGVGFVPLLLIIILVVVLIKS